MAEQCGALSGHDFKGISNYSTLSLRQFADLLDYYSCPKFIRAAHGQKQFLEIPNKAHSVGKEKRGFLSEESTKPFTILLAMKIFQFYKTGFAALLVFLTSVLPVSGNPFYNSLPDSKREEIKIIDDHTV